MRSLFRCGVAEHDPNWDAQGQGPGNRTWTLSNEVAREVRYGKRSIVDQCLMHCLTLPSREFEDVCGYEGKPLSSFTFMDGLDITF